VRDLHTYGKSFKTRFVTIHDTATDGTAVFDANALAKAAGGTPFKRPENGVFRPGTLFTQFFFSETGDTSALTEVGSDFGGFGGVFKLSLSRPGGDTGTLSLFFLGDVEHTGLDNCAFLSANDVVFVECAQSLGKRLANETGSVSERLALGVKLVLGRPPTAAEIDRLSRWYDDALKLMKELPPETGAWVAVARVLLNLDECVNRE
jgi:secreted PhoX family phosphatase